MTVTVETRVFIKFDQAIKDRKGKAQPRTVFGLGSNGRKSGTHLESQGQMEYRWGPRGHLISKATKETIRWYPPCHTVHMYHGYLVFLSLVTCHQEEFGTRLIQSLTTDCKEPFPAYMLFHVVRLRGCHKSYAVSCHPRIPPP